MVNWPPGWERAKRRERGRFRVTFASARRDVQDEIIRINGTNLRIDVDVPLRQDGLPYAKYNQPNDPGCAVYWTKNGAQFVIACDKWSDLSNNMQAIAKTLRAKRDVARWGAATDKAEYEGYRALPPPSGDPSSYLRTELVTPAHVILGIQERASKEQVRQAYRTLVQEAHPDRGGDADRFRKLTEAYQSMMAGA